MPDADATQAAEFTSDEQREAHIAALRVELAHLEVSGAAESALGREAVAKTRARRRGEAEAELTRLGAHDTAEKRPRGAAKETRGG